MERVNSQQNVPGINKRNAPHAGFLFKKSGFFSKSRMARDKWQVSDRFYLSSEICRDRLTQPG
jgi:hypothetical protein